MSVGEKGGGGVGGVVWCGGRYLGGGLGWWCADWNTAFGRELVIH